jgi:hypothetical protein
MSNKKKILPKRNSKRKLDEDQGKQINNIN